MGNVITSEKGAIGRKLAIGIAVVLIVIAGVLFVISKSKNPTKQQAASNSNGYQATADAYIKAISKNDAQAAWDLMTSRDQKKAGTLDDFKKQLSASYFNKSTGSPKFIKAEAQPDQHNTYKNQDPHRVTYEFDFDYSKWQSVVIVIKDKNSWKIDEMDSNQL
ncbi:MAG TPA: hypothetical protein VJR27_05030 [Candidatus Saccharimonadales bacterium]|nr:hypothetical protein [Candidatus Saccharimonadales bacterium]